MKRLPQFARKTAPSLPSVIDSLPEPNAMSNYERARWDELQSHWERKARARQLLPPRVRGALEKTAQVTKESAAKAGRVIVDATPEKAKEALGFVADAALEPTVKSVVHLLELLNDWVVELNDPEEVIKHHQSKGRKIQSLDDLKALDLAHLEEFTRGMVLRWQTLGAGQGASFGALAMIPVPVVGSLAAITLDIVAMQVLSTAIATRVCYAYGYDAADPGMRHMIDRMVVRAYRNQAAKAGTVKNASAAFSAAKGRVRWSKKLREDHRLMAAVEKLLKHLGEGLPGTVNECEARVAQCAREIACDQERLSAETIEQRTRKGRYDRRRAHDRRQHQPRSRRREAASLVQVDDLEGKDQSGTEVIDRGPGLKNDDRSRQARPPAGEHTSERPAHLLPAVGRLPVHA